MIVKFVEQKTKKLEKQKNKAVTRHPETLLAECEHVNVNQYVFGDRQAAGDYPTSFGGYTSLLIFGTLPEKPDADDRSYPIHVFSIHKERHGTTARTSGALPDTIIVMGETDVYIMNDSGKTIEHITC